MRFEQNVGVGGEFRVVVRRADGTVKTDTGMQKNLILANFFEALFTGMYTVGTDKRPVSPASYAFVGDGSSQPEKTQTKLDSFVALANAITSPSPLSEVSEDGAPAGFVRMSYTSTFVFENIKNKNITEVGLGNSVSSPGQPQFDYALHTRALIKDTGGTPTAITVLEGEVLELEYRINLFAKKEHKLGTFLLKEIVGSNETDVEYDYRFIPLFYASGSFTGFDRSITVIQSVGSADIIGTTQNFDINAVEVQNLNWDSNSISAFGSLLQAVSFTKDPNYHNRNNVLLTEESKSHDLDSATETLSYTFGSNLINNVNGTGETEGIRALVVNYRGIGDYPQTIRSKPAACIFVARKDNKEGIPKTRHNKLKFSFSCTYTRME